MDSYSESISSNDEESSDDRTVTVDSDSSATLDFEEAPCEWEADSKGIEATLHQIVAGLQSAAEGYLALASHMSKVACHTNFLKWLLKSLPLLWMSLCLFEKLC